MKNRFTKAALLLSLMSFVAGLGAQACPCSGDGGPCKCGSACHCHGKK